MATTQYYGTGRRKTSTARVFLRPGSGTITINNTPLEASFPTETLRLVIRQPLVVTETVRALRRAGDDGRRRHRRPGRRAAARHRPRAASITTPSCGRRCARPGCSRATRAPRNARSTAWPERVSASSSASVNEVQASTAQREGDEQLERDRDERPAGGRRPLRTPDQALEPEDEALHLRRTQRHLHPRPRPHRQALPRSRGVRHATSPPRAARCCSSAPSARRRTRSPKKRSAAACSS